MNWISHRTLFVFFCVFPVVIPHASSQTSRLSSSDTSGLAATRRVIPGIEYKAGWLHRFLAGAHWRDLWATEFEAEVLDLERFAGGLTPIKKGGSLQTKNLRFKGSDGREYKFRSLNKDGKRALPPELQKSVVADIYQDQISIGNPMASVVVAKMLDAVGVLNAAPGIAVMPFSDRLGEFKEEFGGMLGTIEEHPTAPHGTAPGFGGAEKIIDGFEIFEVLEANQRERVDDVEFLKARLVDILLGDRDRHPDQWRWAGYTVNGKRFWRPIPRDRDFAFGRYDGVFPWMAGLFVHSAVGFGPTYPSMMELTWLGRHLDRRLLGGVDKPVWDSLVTFIKNSLPDSVLHEAMRSMPPEMYKTAGERMFRMTQARRDKLDEAAREFFRLLSDAVDVYGTDSADRAEVIRLNDTQLDVRLYGKESGDLLFRRIFSSAHTSEVRIHLLGGNDAANIEGNEQNGILVRVIGGKGTDEFADRTRVAGTVFYDDEETTAIFTGSATRVELGPEDSAAIKQRMPEPVLEDRYDVWRVWPVLGFNSDDGVLLGASPRLTQYGFRIEPYAHYLELTGAVAPQSGHYDVRFFGEFCRMLRGARFELLATASDLGVTDFHGFGNESARDKGLADAGFYETHYRTIRIQPSIHLRSSRTTVSFGGTFEYANAKVEPNTLLDRLNPYGVGTHSILGVTGGVLVDGRDNIVAPSRGFSFEGRGALYPPLLGNDFTFGKLRADLRVYAPAKFLTELVLAAHLGGEKIFGTYPFYHASVIGNVGTVRGFARDRFAGSASAYAQAELRAALAPVNVFVPGMLGLSLFGDTGRVFYSGERSRTWHTGFGGGLWFNAVNKIVLSLAVASSTEDLRFYLTSGFGF